jgi:hypothetical protein
MVSIKPMLRVIRIDWKYIFRLGMPSSGVILYSRHLTPEDGLTRKNICIHLLDSLYYFYDATPSVSPIIKASAFLWSNKYIPVGMVKDSLDILH